MRISVLSFEKYRFFVSSPGQSAGDTKKNRPKPPSRSLCLLRKRATQISHYDKEIETSIVGVYWIEWQTLLRFSWKNTEYPTLDKSTSKIPAVLKPCSELH